MKYDRFVFALVSLFIAACRPQSAGTEPLPAIWELNHKLITENVRAMVDGNPATRGFAPDKTILNIFDFDHTLSDNTTKVPVTTASGEHRFSDSKCIILAEGDIPDYSIFDNEPVYATEPVAPALKHLQSYVKESSNWNAIVTARSGRRTFSMVVEYLWQKNAEPDAVIAANFSAMHKRLWEQIKYPQGMQHLPKGAKKPLIIAALVELMREKGSNPKKVRYFEDTDEYLISAMTFLPKHYPELEFEFYDYVRTFDQNRVRYTEVKAATGAGGKLYKPNQESFTDPERYDSADCKINAARPVQ